MVIKKRKKNITANIFISRVKHSMAFFHIFLIISYFIFCYSFLELYYRLTPSPMAIPIYFNKVLISSENHMPKRNHWQLKNFFGILPTQLHIHILHNLCILLRLGYMDINVSQWTLITLFLYFIVFISCWTEKAKIFIINIYLNNELI